MINVAWERWKERLYPLNGGDAVVTFAHIAVNVVPFKAETALLPHAIVRLMRQIKKNLCGCVTFCENVEKYR